MGAVIDTSWLIAFERQSGNQTDVTGLLPDGASISAVTVAELRIGVELADEERRPAREAFVEAVIAALPVLAFGEPEARVFSRVSANLRRLGTPISDRDLMIAATAVANDLPVATLNISEFQRVPGLQVVDLPLPGASSPR